MFSTFITTLFLIQSSPAAAKPVASKPAHVKPAAAKPVAAKPAHVKPAAKPSSSKIARGAARPETRPAAVSPVQPKTPGRVIAGTTGKKTTSVRLANARPAERVVERKKPDKRKIRPAEEKRPQVVAFPPMGIYNIHQREFASIRVYDENGHFRTKALEEFNHISRCLHTGVQLPMDYRLLTEVYQAWLHFGMPSVTLFSGCRQAPHASKGSRHNFGLAVDFNFDGVPRREVISYFLKRRENAGHGMGVGYYPNSFHVHVDVREKHAFWVDLQPGGEKGSMVVANPMRWFLEEGSRCRRADKMAKMEKTPATAAVVSGESTDEGQESQAE